MSTRIDSGCEIIGHTLESFLLELRRLREQCEVVAAQLAHNWIVNRAAHLHDLKHLGLPLELRCDIKRKPTDSFLEHAWEELDARQANVTKTKRRDAAVDFSGEVVLFPLKGRLLAMALFENAEMQALWRQQPWYRDYGYWDNTDGPDDVDDEAWEQRNQDWSEVFSQSSVPSEVGYTFTLAPERTWLSRPPEQVLLAAIPDSAVRAKLVALDSYLAAHPSAEGWDHATESRFSALMRKLRAIQSSPEFAEWRTKLEGELPELTVAALDSPVGLGPNRPDEDD